MKTIFAIAAPVTAEDTGVTMALYVTETIYSVRVTHTGHIAAGNGSRDKRLDIRIGIIFAAV